MAGFEAYCLDIVLTFSRVTSSSVGESQNPPGFRHINENPEPRSNMRYDG